MTDVTILFGTCAISMGVDCSLYNATIDSTLQRHMDNKQTHTHARTHTRTHSHTLTHTHTQHTHVKCY